MSESQWFLLLWSFAICWRFRFVFYLIFPILVTTSIENLCSLRWVRRSVSPCPMRCLRFGIRWNAVLCRVQSCSWQPQLNLLSKGDIINVISIPFLLHGVTVHEASDSSCEPSTDSGRTINQAYLCHHLISGTTLTDNSQYSLWYLSIPNTVSVIEWLSEIRTNDEA